MSYWICRFLILFHRYAAATGCIWNHWTAPDLLALHRVGEHGTALLTPLRSRRIRSGATRMISCVEVRQEEEILCHNATLCIKIWRTLYLYEGTYGNNTLMRNQKGKSDVACHVLRQGCKRGSHCLLMHIYPALLANASQGCRSLAYRKGCLLFAWLLYQRASPAFLNSSGKISYRNGSL
jgi:hypothetical protein